MDAVLNRYFNWFLVNKETTTDKMAEFRRFFLIIIIINIDPDWYGYGYGSISGKRIKLKWNYKQTLTWMIKHRN